jgi:hypothetical protein
MSNNDRILLDALLQKASANYGAARKADEYLELFVFDQLLRDYYLSLDELIAGWVDGAQDGGIDGFFLLVDGRPITEAPEPEDVGPNPNVVLHIVTVRSKDSFQEAPVNALTSSVQQLFDLGRERKELEAVFGEDVLDARAAFRATVLGLAVRHPRLRIERLESLRTESFQWHTWGI